nr:glycosyltransferase family 4 protein [Quadrisphaera sp. RL12-1S]
MSESHVKALRLQSKRVQVIPNDIARPNEVLPMLVRGRRAIFLGEVSRRKGVDLLLQAWSAAETAGWQLEIYGEIKDEDLFDQFPELQGHYKGYASGPLVNGLLSQASIFVLPSRAEAFSMAVVEAMANGCSLIVTDVGAIQEMIAAEAYGQIVPGNDWRSLSSLMTRQMASTQDREDFALSNREASKRFDQETVNLAWVETYFNR